MITMNAENVITNVEIVKLLPITVPNVTHQESTLHLVSVLMVSSITVTLVLVVLTTVLLVLVETLVSLVLISDLMPQFVNVLMDIMILVKPPVNLVVLNVSLVVLLMSVLNVTTQL
jgi:hypothetical protein